MPAKDKYHVAVVHALQKDGWTIVTDQVHLRLGDRRLWIDLRVRHDSQDIILVEVKSYDTTTSPVAFLQHALGQYLMYRAILDETGISDPIYLAIPEQANVEIMQSELGQLIIDKYRLNLLVYSIDDEEIVKWIHNS